MSKHSNTLHNHEDKDHTDPAYVGPGYWNLIHQTAWNIKTDEDVQLFVELMDKIKTEFPCKTCREHCVQYMNENPMEEYIAIEHEGKRIGLFVWSWKFHNAVNARIGKPIMSWNTAYSMYSSTECGTTCSALG
jgi:hypothetical protein